MSGTKLLKPLQTEKEASKIFQPFLTKNRIKTLFFQTESFSAPLIFDQSFYISDEVEIRFCEKKTDEVKLSMLIARKGEIVKKVAKVANRLLNRLNKNSGVPIYIL